MEFSINNPQFWRKFGGEQDQIEELELEIDQDGNIKIPDKIRKKLNLPGGTELKVEVGNNGMKIKRVDPNLTRVYIEPTTDCNLDCEMCLRQAWDENIGNMNYDVYQIMAQM